MHSFILQIYQKYTLGERCYYSRTVTGSHTDTHPRPPIEKRMVSHLAQIRLPFFFFHCLDFTGSPKCVFHSVLTCCFHHQSPISVSKKTPTQLSLLFIWLFEICFFNSILIISISKTFSFYMLCVLRLDASVTFPCWVGEQMF